MVKQMIRGQPPVTRVFAEMICAQKDPPLTFMDLETAAVLTGKILEDSIKSLDESKFKKEKICRTT